MSETVYAAFADAAHAESAAGALLDHGIAASDISLVLNEEAKKKVTGFTDSAAMGSQATIVSGPAGATYAFDPLGNDLRAGAGTPPIPGGNMFPLGQTAEVNADLNPALDDYPRTDADSPTELSSRPPHSKYDWNPDLDKKSYNADYERPLSEKGDDEIRLEAERERASVDPTATAIITGHDADVREYDADRAAKAGVSTTTIQDAAVGAAKGVGYGIGVGALAAVASLAIPGFGLVIGGGALAVAVAGLAATAGAGAVAGGVVGYLKDQGVPADEIPVYQAAYEDGGAILSVIIQDPLKAVVVQDLLRKYGASNVRPFGYAA